MRYILMIAAAAILAGCATAATTGKGRVYYDRKYNTTYQLRSEASGNASLRTGPVYDRKYNTYLPVRSASRP